MQRHTGMDESKRFLYQKLDAEVSHNSVSSFAA